MYENGIVGSPESCVEPDELLFAEEVFRFLFSND